MPLSPPPTISQNPGVGGVGGLHTRTGPGCPPPGRDLLEQGGGVQGSTGEAPPSLLEHTQSTGNNKIIGE